MDPAQPTQSDLTKAKKRSLIGQGSKYAVQNPIEGPDTPLIIQEQVSTVKPPSKVHKISASSINMNPSGGPGEKATIQKISPNKRHQRGQAMLMGGVSTNQGNMDEEQKDAQLVKLGFQERNQGVSNLQQDEGYSPPGKTRQQLEDEMMQQLLQIQAKITAEVDEESGKKDSISKISNKSSPFSRGNKPILALHEISPIHTKDITPPQLSTGQKKQEEMMEVDSVKSETTNQSPKANRILQQMHQSQEEEGQQPLRSHQRNKTLHMFDEIIAQEVNQMKKDDDDGSLVGARPSSQEISGGFILPTEKQFVSAQRRPSGQPSRIQGGAGVSIQPTILPQTTQFVREDLVITPKKEKPFHFDRVGSISHLRQDSLSSQANTPLASQQLWGELVKKSQQDLLTLKEKEGTQKQALELKLDQDRALFLRNQNPQSKGLFPKGLNKDKAYAFLQQQDFEMPLHSESGRLSMRKQSIIMPNGKYLSLSLHNLLHYMIVGSFRIHSLVISDYELNTAKES
ncbi:hypothetical protein FGO68_gene4778 [Halteria grandinella]|uniref:Uncharacterized protein n=1 Tax=Halteria grandinella TaxID=5974 RepID=A0A8J8TA94_HALGN|nr:hypothetical protein FGO68_gene4778 [Halteria grandinella]